MRILIVTQYFWPENFKINSLANELKIRGHKIVVLTGLPNYPSGKIMEGYSLWKNNNEIWNEIQIYRSKIIPRYSGGGVNLFLNYISFVFFSSIKLFSINTKIDLIFVYQPSPVTVGIPAILAKYRFKAPIYFWVQDLWPDSLKDAGGLTNKLILGLVNTLTKFIYKKSKIILVQSKAFVSYILNQGVPISKIHYFPNPTENFYKVLEIDLNYINQFKNGFNLIFAGNIGEAQSFDTLIEAALILKKHNLPIFFNILGDGRAKDNYVNKVASLNLQDIFLFLGAYPPEVMPRYFSCADALIVSLKKSKIFSLTIPAKVQSYLACGKPIIGSIDGEGARIILESKAGYISSSEDANALANNIVLMYKLTKAERIQIGNNGREYFEKEFSMKILLKNFELVIKKESE
jgi:glycosyltransferase involved in cell wall biosynthesis